MWTDVTRELVEPSLDHVVEDLQHRELNDSDYELLLLLERYDVSIYIYKSC